MIVFAGPSLAGADAEVLDTFDLRPPAQQGDVYLATLETPRAIGIIDGYFEGVPAVWHKEILWALTQGIAVYGASSMGALRAAELDAFGMIGLGAIYDDYRDDVLEDDDEVALLHGPAEVGYPGLSVAMVNVRATLKAAQEAGVVSSNTAETLIARAKTEFYKTRTWDSIFRTGETGGQGDTALPTLQTWIAQNEVDQKRLDAQLLLRHMAEEAHRPPSASFHFEQTALWHDAVQSWRQRARQESAATHGGYRLTGGLSFRDD
ncbi:TfuA-like protein [uncultured Roseobacter sp.]|uniref:TfuA-like protein n=1 Tax=uncultured Roseobacter sp. TaxID=114847 RepID=UPI0026038F25|nr:TfuA-like protein [uncultured Roseobacter sp.]